MTELFSADAEKARFYELDYLVMKHAFDIQNCIGRFHDEMVYQNELMHRLKVDGLQVQSEEPVTIKFKSFNKTYLLDLLVEDRHIYELKCTSSLTNANRSQLINYQLITERSFGKLINFGAPSVQHEFVTSKQTLADRRQFEIDDADWDSRSETGQLLHSLSCELFSEWGTGLDPNLYTEAIMDLMPGSSARRIPTVFGSRQLGSKQMNLLSPNTAFKLTMVQNIQSLMPHFKKLLQYSELETIQWINITRSRVSYSSLHKNNPVI